MFIILMVVNLAVQRCKRESSVHSCCGGRHLSMSVCRQACMSDTTCRRQPPVAAAACRRACASRLQSGAVEAGGPHRCCLRGRGGCSGRRGCRRSACACWRCRCCSGCRTGGPPHLHAPPHPPCLSRTRRPPPSPQLPQNTSTQTTVFAHCIFPDMLCNTQQTRLTFQASKSIQEHTGDSPIRYGEVRGGGCGRHDPCAALLPA